jgi:ribonuclease Z
MRKRTKALFAVAVFALISGIAVKSWQAEIGSALFERAVMDRVGRDSSAGLPDGLHVALCGTGSPLPSPDRAGPCNVVIAGKRIFVVDIGEGGSRNISMMGLPLSKVEALFLTHFHSDHIDGLGPLLMGRWTSGSATSPLPVYGAAGVEKVVAGFKAAYEIDDGHRIAHHGPAIVPPSGAGGVAMPFSLPEGSDRAVIYDQGGLRVTAIQVDHGPVKPALGYRFDYKGRSIVFSGDTKKSASLIAASKGADLLVHEALQPKLVKMMSAGFEQKGMKNMAQITKDILNYHASPEEAAESAQEAGVKHLVLSHIVPPTPSRFFKPAFLGDAPKRYQGALTLGEDGMLFSLPAGSSEIVQSKLK